jgi:hypothetical protein
MLNIVPHESAICTFLKLQSAACSERLLRTALCRMDSIGRVLNRPLLSSFGVLGTHSRDAGVRVSSLLNVCVLHHRAAVRYGTHGSESSVSLSSPNFDLRQVHEKISRPKKGDIVTPIAQHVILRRGNISKLVL